MTWGFEVNEAVSGTAADGAFWGVAAAEVIIESHGKQ
jgi:hypothetical protein